MRTKDVKLKRLISVMLAFLLCLATFAGCSSTGTAEDSDETAAITEEIISEEDFKAVFDNAVPYEDGYKLSSYSAKGEDIKPEGDDGNSLAAAKYFYPDDSSVVYNTVYSGYATSTLILDGYNYNVGNMLDWDLSTCWAEGNPYSEGTMEGFAYLMDEGARVDGFRIFPGYQKSMSTFRSNILPVSVIVEAGGYTFTCDLDEWLMDLSTDDDYFWIDVYFDTPVYTDSIYVTIAAVGTFGNDPDYDCCITEFHPFHF